MFWAEESPSQRLPSSRLKAMIEMIDKTQADELTCEEVHTFLCQFAELTYQKKKAELPLVAHHLALCLECREEYEALVRILNAPGGETLQHE
jgi:hypothetical protein